MLKRIVIIGGGISGLAATYRLQELTADRACEIILLEASNRFGGVIQTEKRDGFILEGGPDCFISERPAALDLAKKIGLEAEIIETNSSFRRSLIYHDSQLMPVPKGFYLMIPRSLPALFAAPLLSLRGKLRMAWEPFIPARKDGRDESVAAFVRRRLGTEVLEKIAQPMIGGIYTADPEKLSMMATFPQFRQWEREHGSVIHGLKKSKNGSKDATGPRYSLFLSFKNGMQTLTDALVKKLNRVTLRSDFPVSEILWQGRKWRIKGEKGENLEADAVCMTLPPYRASSILKSAAPDLTHKIEEIPYESVATINCIYKRAQIEHPLDGFGFVVPDKEEKKIMACTFTTVKFSGRAPEGYAVLRAFAGGALRRSVFQMSDENLQKTVLDELREILKIKGEPTSVLISRWPRSMLQYPVGHLEQIHAIEDNVKNYPGLFLTGGAYRGIGIPACIEHAQMTAEKMASYLYES